MIAEMAIRVEATSLLVRKAAWNLDKGIRNPIVSSYAKAYGADSAMQTAVDAVQVFGGNGFMKEYPVEKLMRDAKVLQIYEGTCQIQRIVIAKHVARRMRVVAIVGLSLVATTLRKQPRRRAGDPRRPRRSEESDARRIRYVARRPLGVVALGGRKRNSGAALHPRSIAWPIR